MSSSGARRRTRRLITCPAMSRAAIPVMPPKTVSAIVSGRSVASAVAMMPCDSWYTKGRPLGSARFNSASTAERWRSPP